MPNHTTIAIANSSLQGISRAGFSKDLFFSGKIWSGPGDGSGGGCEVPVRHREREGDGLPVQRGSRDGRPQGRRPPHHGQRHLCQCSARLYPLDREIVSTIVYVSMGALSFAVSYVFVMKIYAAIKAD